MADYDAILLVSFGGPEAPDDVLPFLENVVRGKPVSRTRMLEVAAHYQQFGGVSPLNRENRRLIEALRRALDSKGPRLPIYWGNRNWHPLLTDTIQQMQHDGVRRAIALVTSAFSCYSGCRQYRENIQAARELVGQQAPEIDKIRVYYNHPGFIAAMADQTSKALDGLGPLAQEARLIFTAHSIPAAMAANSRYEHQLREACRLVAHQLGRTDWALAYQSRSGPPHQPWLEPDILDYLRQRPSSLSAVVLVPIGFIADHMEVIFDLDTEARGLCDQLGIPMRRAATVGTHPQFIEAVRELVAERVENWPTRAALGRDGPFPDRCPSDCCLA